MPSFSRRRRSSSSGPDPVRISQRDALDHYIARTLAPAGWTRARDLLPDSSYLDELPDRVSLPDARLWSPEVVPGLLDPLPRRLLGAPSRLVAPQAGARSVPKSQPNRVFATFSPPAQVAFSHPEVTSVCIRRATRRAVLHALRRLQTHPSGSGARRRSDRRMTPDSKISCRR